MRKLTPTNLQKLQDDAPASIRCDRQSPLILISGSGEVTFARTREEKDRMVALFKEKRDLLILSALLASAFVSARGLFTKDYCNKGPFVK